MMHLSTSSNASRWPQPPRSRRGAATPRPHGVLPLLPCSRGLPCRATASQGPQNLLEGLSSAAGGASAAMERLQRYMTPPPAGFPPGPPGDQSLSLLSDPLACISRLRREHGPLVGLLLGGERVVLVAEPEAAKQVLVGQPDIFVKAGTAFFPGSSLTGNGLLVSDGPEWRRQRRLSNPAFRKTAVDKYSSAMISEAHRLLDGPFAAAATANDRQQWQQQQQQAPSATAAAAAAAPSLPAGVRDVYADFNQLTLNITLSALFSITGDDSSDSSSSSRRAAIIVAAVEKAFSHFAARGATAMVVPEWVPTPDNVAFREAVQQLDALVYSIIDSRTAALGQQQQQEVQDALRQDATAGDGSSGSSSSSRSGSGQAAKADLLQALLESRDDSGRAMARTALRDELMTLLVAGQETSAILLGWAAALLAHNPKMQAAAAAEVAAVLGSNGGSLGPQDIPRLPYLTAVVLEALRLWSPAYMVGRCANRDVELVGGYVLPAGTTCLVSPYLLHREPTRWKQPTVFKPERWLHLLQPQQQQQQPTGQMSSAQPQQVQAQGSCPFSSDASAPQQQQQPQQQAQQLLPSGAAGGACPYSSNGSSSSSPSGYNFSAVLRDLGPNGAYVPFGGGPRNCIGTGFAMTEAVLVLALLLQRYELQPVSRAAGFPRPKPMLTLRPEAVPLRVVRRQQQQQQQPQAEPQQPQQQAELVAAAAAGGLNA